MDLFGFKKRRRQRERDAQIRAEALNRAVKTVQRPTTPPAPPRRRRPETDAPDSYGGIYPHASGYGLDADYNRTSWTQPQSSSSDDTSSRSSSHDSFGAAGSGLNLGGSSYDSGSSSSSSSYDSGSSSSSDSGGY